MDRIIMEACCGSVDDCIQVTAAGVDRIELNSALELGGLTPSAGMLTEALSLCPGVRIMAMIRPRSGGFHYTDAEFRAMCRDAELFMKLGADGLVFGPLTADGDPDRARIRTLVEIASGKETVFHRAIDVCRDWRAAIDELISLGITRILTSGQQRTALLGSETIREMRELGRGEIEILPAGGIRIENVADVIRQTGCRQIHFARHIERADPSMRFAHGITFHGKQMPEDRYRESEGTYYHEMRHILDELDER